MDLIGPLVALGALTWVEWKHAPITRVANHFATLGRKSAAWITDERGAYAAFSPQLRYRDFYPADGIIETADGYLWTGGEVLLPSTDCVSDADTNALGERLNICYAGLPVGTWVQTINRLSVDDPSPFDVPLKLMREAPPALRDVVNTIYPARLKQPFRLDITPESNPETVIQCAVGGTTMFIFDMEKPVGLKSGLFEQLGYEKSDEDYPGHVVYLRPTAALTGLTTNVVIETDTGRASFFVKVVHPEHGVKPGDFHGEVHISTAGAESSKRRLEAKMTELASDVERARNQVTVAESARVKAEQRATEARGEGAEQGRVEALAGMAQLPLKGKKRRAINAAGMRLQQLARVEAEGATWLVYELRNMGKVARRLDGVSVSGEGRTLMHAPHGDVFPGRSARISLWVSGAKAADNLVFHVTGGTIRTGVAE